MPAKKLGEILVENSMIQEYQLKAALADQTAFGGRLGSHLVRMGYITEEALINVLAHQLTLPIINLRKSHIKFEALARVKKEICVKYGLIPIARKAKNGAQTLLIATSDPTDYNAVTAVEFASGCRVTLALSVEKDILKAIQFCYTDAGPRECVGERDLADGLTIDFSQPSEPGILMTSEGIEKNLDNDNRDAPAVRAVVELLIRKGVISREEYRRVLAEIQKR